MTLAVDIPAFSMIHTAIYALLIYIAIIDIRKMIIPNLPLFLFTLAAGVDVYLRTPDQFLLHLLCLVLTFIVLAGFYAAVLMKLGQEGLGFGDVKLFSAGGLWVGFDGVSTMLLIASILGLGYGLALSVKLRISRQLKFPFGPFVCAGIVAGKALNSGVFHHVSP
ncbi:MAG: prepilin peptidase [Pannonibacter indicus]